MSGYAHPEVLVETQWLIDHLNDPNVRIVEVDGSPEPYKDAHIPGAVFWNFFQDLLNPNLSMHLDPSAIASVLFRSGITPETTVIAYGSYPGTGAWIFWLLKTIGHENVLVLNGGHQKWVAEGRPLATDLASFPPTHYKPTGLNSSLRVLQPEVQAALNQPDHVFLDVRTTPEFKGRVFMIKPAEGTERGGHIPGAIHLEFSQTLNEDGTFKSVEELRSLFTQHGITPDKTIFPYCAVGGRSAFMWFVLKYLLGYPNVRNYDGSWNEWGRLPDTAIAQG